METIIVSFILLLLLIYVFFVWLWIRTVFGPGPADGVCHTTSEIQANWAINRPPLLYGPILSSLVLSHDAFFFVASILGGVLIYLKTKSIGCALLALVGLLIIVRIGLKKSILILMRPGLKKHWDHDSCDNK